MISVPGTPHQPFVRSAGGYVEDRRSFINGLPGDRASARLVPTVISLARALI